MIESFTTDLVIGILYAAIAFALSARTTAAVIVTGAMLALASRGLTQAIHDAGTKISSTTNSLYTATIEHLQSLKAAKTYDADARNSEVFWVLSWDVVRASVAGVRAQAVATTCFELGSVVILAIVVYCSIRIFTVPPVAILILLLLFARVMPRIINGHQHYLQFVSLFPSCENLIAIEARCLAAVEPPAPLHRRLSLKHQLAAEDISFTYSEGRPPALQI
jgi:ABC-type multidrug transport system fused ATPase/permease subunit